MIELRRLTDIDRLMKWRREVLENVFGSEPDVALLAANRRFYAEHVPDGTHFAVIACRNGEEAGCGAVCFYDELPSPDNHSGRCAYIMNVYVRPAFRHEGVATSILRHLIQEARAGNCGKIYLETTDMGRSVYNEVGFMDMKDMMKYED
ncbi:MAG: GNAT family N-acetyltransferase [Lachnospiraceae bacterium]|nr:GNAT family N-acetyltransferase [Lachnospiraceae bacterium]